MAKIKRVPGPGAKQLEVFLKGAGNMQGKVGWFESARYENGTPVATVAAVHEFGAPSKNIPPRPFFRPTIAAKQGEWRGIAENQAQKMLKGQATTRSALETIGLKAAGDVAKTIASITTPPLKQATIAARKRRRADRKTTGNLTKPLVDTGLMISTITNTVESAK